MSISFKVGLGYFPGYDETGLDTPNDVISESNDISATLYLIYGPEMILEWSVPDYLGACTFDVFRSDTEYGPWDKINSNVLTGNTLKVTREVKDSKFISNFFLIECTPVYSFKIRSGVITLQNVRSDWVNLRAREIQRREWLLLRKFTGINSLVFRRKTFGQRCSQCWDPVAKKVLQDNCPTCLGTSFEGGYFTGYETYLQYDPTPNTTTLGYQGKLEPNQIQAWTISYPSLANLDVVLRIPDGKIYRIDSVQSTELQTVPVRQMVLLTELSKNNIEYQLISQALPSEIGALL